MVILLQSQCSFIIIILYFVIMMEASIALSTNFS